MSDIPYKYNEPALLKELEAYIAKTYDGHYVSEDNIQALDIIFATGRGEGFTVGNVLKYASRLGKKNDTSERQDLWKIVHYALLSIFLYDRRIKRESLQKLAEHLSLRKPGDLTLSGVVTINEVHDQEPITTNTVQIDPNNLPEGTVITPTLEEKTLTL